MPIPASLHRLVRGPLFFCAGLLAAGLARAADPIQEVGKTASEWVKTRAETVRLETAWTQDRAMLGSTLNALKERAERLQDRRDHLLAVTAEERAEQAALNAKLTTSRESLQATETRLIALTEKIVRLRPLLPPRLADALEMSYRSLANPAASPAERMQLVMTVLNRCAQFNHTLTHGEEVLTLEGEAGPKAVDVIYWGLGQGYALDRAAGKAWLGTPGTERWQWEPLPGAAPAVATLMAIRLDEADPQFVSIPARLKPAR
ncbi:DUF3450 family protein [Lacunisphaera limnophila]|nr:DUF3450 family protein [Lacunisphaera limnophila]